MESQGHDGGGGGGGQRPRVSLLVRNLNFHSSPDDVRMAFSEFGPIRDVYLPLDFHTGEPRGFGFVEFESSKDAYDAMYAMHNTVLHGSTIHVTIAKKGRSDPVQMRRRELRGEFDRDGPRNSHRDRVGRRWASSRSPSSFRYRPQQRRGRSGSGSSGSAYGGGAGGARPTHGGKGGGGDAWLPARDRDRSLSRDDRRARPRSSKSRRSLSPYRGRRSTSLSRSRSPPAFRERKTFSSEDSEEDRVSGARGRNRKERDLHRSRGRDSRSRRRSKGREHSSSNSRGGSRSRRHSSVSSRNSGSRRHSSKSSRSGERTDSLSPGGEDVAYTSRRDSRSRRRKESEPDGEDSGRRNSIGSGTSRQVLEEDNHLRSSRSRSRSSTQTSEGRRRRSASSPRSKRNRSRSRGSHRRECGGRGRRDEDSAEREEEDKHVREDGGERDAGKEFHADSKEGETVASLKLVNEEDAMTNLLDEKEDITPNGHSRTVREDSDAVLPNAEETTA